MKTSTDIIIHIDDNLDTAHNVTLSEKVQKIAGVISTSLEGVRPHFMIIGYNPKETKACDILSGVRETGTHAYLIAWM